MAPYHERSSSLEVDDSDNGDPVWSADYWSGAPHSESVPGTSIQSAVADVESHQDLVCFLSVIRNFSVDLLPITWQPALDSLGSGGTATIQQSLVNSQMSLAFKRIDVAEWTRPRDELRAYQVLISEVQVLRHPALRGHPNIINLEGVCWEIKTGTESVWPVLVFEKTEFGDLQHFMNSSKGKGLSFQTKLGLCVDVASAIMRMHSCRMPSPSPLDIVVFGA